MGMGAGSDEGCLGEKKKKEIEVSFPWSEKVVTDGWLGSSSLGGNQKLGRGRVRESSEEREGSRIRYSNKTTEIWRGTTLSSYIKN